MTTSSAVEGQCGVGVPTLCIPVLAEPRFNRDLVSRIRLFVFGSALLSAGTLSDFSKRFDQAIVEHKGMSKTAGSLLAMPYIIQYRYFPLSSLGGFFTVG